MDGRAIKYLNIFDKEAKELLLRCAKYLKSKINNAKSIFKFIVANKDHRDTIGERFAHMDNMNTEQCDNWSHITCKDIEKDRGNVDDIKGNFLKPPHYADTLLHFPKNVKTVPCLPCRSLVSILMTSRVDRSSNTV